jgi:DNA-binding transcriptional LysR family regulator
MDLAARVIRAIAETGHSPADWLHVSQSAIGRQVILLEEVGRAVFHRVGRKVRIRRPASRCSG